MFHSASMPAMRRTKLARMVARAGVHHFGMKLHAIEAALLIGDHREGRTFRGRHHGKAGGMAVILSPWLIHTGSLPDSARPSSSGEAFLTWISARPNRGYGRFPPCRPAEPTWSFRHSRCPAPARPTGTPMRCARAVGIGDAGGPPDRMIAWVFSPARHRPCCRERSRNRPGLAHAPGDQLVTWLQNQ